MVNIFSNHNNCYGSSLFTGNTSKINYYLSQENSQKNVVTLNSIHMRQIIIISLLFCIIFLTIANKNTVFAQQTTNSINTTITSKLINQLSTQKTNQLTNNTDSKQDLPKSSKLSNLLNNK